MKKIDIVIVDDEIANVELLKYYIVKYCPLANIVGTATTKKEAIMIINTLKPQLLFLDIILDEGTSFDILAEMQYTDVKTIFVTAFDEYAVKAFKVSAVDYVLKPVKVEELILAYNKAVKDIENTLYTNNQHLRLVSESIKNQQPLNILAIPSMDKINFVELTSILYLKSDGRYTEFYLTDGSKMVSSKNLGEYEEMINEIMFFRIHNSYMVNLNHVVNINKSDGNYCKMKNSMSLPIAKRRQDKLRKFLKIK